jgi:molybdopterin synthase catalytic subunit
MAPRFAVTADVLSLETLASAVMAQAGESQGALTSFLGLVRAHNLGRTVTYLEYEAYDPLALKAFARIAQEVAESWPEATIGVHHRTGRLEIGDASIAIVAAAAHRAEAFAACRYVIERVKQIAPIWKHEHFDGGESWIEGATADPDDEEARRLARERACA